MKVAITGAAGSIGRVLMAGLTGHQLTGFDLEAGPAAGLDVTDVDALTAALAGQHAVVHLAAIPGEASWPEIVQSNLTTTWSTVEAARRAGVVRVVLASSNHAVGYTPASTVLTETTLPRPDSLYGVSKVTMEALGSLYADAHGLEVVCLRIGSFLPEPTERRHLATWLSPGDAVRLVQAALTGPVGTRRFVIAYGCSNNTRRSYQLAAAEALGYRPVDNAETYRAAIEAVGTDWPYQGGPFAQGEPGDSRD